MTFEILHLLSLKLKFLLKVADLQPQWLAFLCIVEGKSLYLFKFDLLFNFIVPHFLNHLILNFQFLP